jgi:hypothetical protein
MEEIIISEAETPIENSKSKEKKAKEKIDTGAIKIQLPPLVSQKITDLQNQLKDRGYNGKIDDILSVIWDQITDEWCEVRVEALTPDEYYLNAIKNLPDVRQKIVDQAKKALLKAREESGKGSA